MDVSLGPWKKEKLAFLTVNGLASERQLGRQKKKQSSGLEGSLFALKWMFTLRWYPWPSESTNGAGLRAQGQLIRSRASKMLPLSKKCSWTTTFSFSSAAVILSPQVSFALAATATSFLRFCYCESQQRWRHFQQARRFHKKNMSAVMACGLRWLRTCGSMQENADRHFVSMGDARTEWEKR